MRVLYARVVRCVWLACLLSTGFSTAALAAGAEPRPDVIVSAAVSLGDVLARLGPPLEQRLGVHLVVNLAASNVLARQIAGGARVDLFISADEAQMDAVASQLLPGTRVVLVRNELAVAVPRDARQTIRRVADLLDPGFRRIAMGDPESVPAGVYARQYLERIGLWASLRPRLIPSVSVRAALASVEHGAADAAFVYRTDLAAAPRARLALVIPAADGPPIAYPAAVVRTGRRAPDARRVLEWLRGPEALAVFHDAGFLTP